MFTSEKISKNVMRTLYIYIGVTLFIGLFSTIYEINSHKVYSASMVFAFVFPLVLGVGMYLLIRLLPTKRVPGILPATIYHFGVAMATVRNIFIGVLEIYGTTNKNMVAAYTIIMWISLSAGLALYLFILIYWTIKTKKESQRLTVE